MKLEYPLNDVLPSIDHARDRLLARIYRYRQDQEALLVTTDEDSALLYAYSESPGYCRSSVGFTDSDLSSSCDWTVVQRNQ